MGGNKQPGDVIVISPYSTYLEEVRNGSAKYIRQLLDNTVNTNFLVLNALHTNSDQQNIRGNVTVVPSWKNNSPFLYRGVLTEVKKNPGVPLVINFEFQAYGGFLGLIGLWWTLLYIKVFARNPIHIIFHPNILSVSDLMKLSEHLALKMPWFSSTIMSVGMSWYARLLFALAASVVTFEETFRGRLSSLVRNKQKIHVIPHHVYGNELAPPLKHLKHTPLRLLFFGFIVPYKGLELLLETIKKIAPNEIELTVAGGVSPTARDPKYKDRITDEFSKSSNVKYVGYVDDNKVADLFAYTDVLVLPYKVLLAASGPLAWAIGTSTSFILSEQLAGYLEADDFRKIMDETEITAADICFPSSVAGMSELINKLARDQEAYCKLAILTNKLHSTRTIQTIAANYLSLWFGEQSEK